MMWLPNLEGSRRWVVWVFILPAGFIDLVFGACDNELSNMATLPIMLAGLVGQLCFFRFGSSQLNPYGSDYMMTVC